MIEVVDTLNTFASNEAASPSEEQFFILSSSQLQDLIERAVERATEPLWDKIEQITIDAAYSNQRIKMLESKPTPSDSPLIDELYTHMKSVGLKQTTFTGAAKILDVTRGRIHQLKAMIALDSRFIILPSESHKQKMLIRLREVEKL